MNARVPTDTYTTTYTCPACQASGEVKLQVARGQTFVAMPDLWCLKCEEPVPMIATPPAKVEESPIVKPVLVSPFNQIRRAN